MNFIEQFAQAIATMEGYFKAGSIAQRNNNPGNLRSWGSRPVVNGYAYFDTPDQGWAALRRQIELNISRGLTLQEFFGGKSNVYAGYAPAADKNNPTGYAAFVAGRLGVPVNQPLPQIQLAWGGSTPPAASPPPLQTAPGIQLLNPGAGQEPQVIYAALAVAAASVIWMLWEG